MPGIANVLFDDDNQTDTTLLVQGSLMKILTRNIYGKVVDQAAMVPRRAR